MKIYIASKANHRPLWREYRDRGFNIISRWIDTDDKFSIDPSGLDYAKLWAECLEDVAKCDALVCYYETGETLKGALVEIGAALALNKIVWFVSHAPKIDVGTWIYHKDIRHGCNLEMALYHLTNS